MATFKINLLKTGVLLFEYYCYTKFRNKNFPFKIIGSKNKKRKDGALFFRILLNC